jgi:DNA-binding CsgD family transcriptional regulator
MKVSILKKYHIISLALLIGIILFVYGILNPKNHVNTFGNAKTNITIINLNEVLEPNYILIFGISLIVFSILIFFFEYFLKNKGAIKPTLTNKENEILELLQQGKTNKEIASEFFISVSTVKTHINNIFKKMNISNRNELLLKNNKD